jgi:hypothetical protein
MKANETKLNATEVEKIVNELKEEVKGRFDFN